MRTGLVHGGSLSHRKQSRVWLYLIVEFQQRNVTSFYQTLNSNCSSQNRTLCNSPATSRLHRDRLFASGSPDFIGIRCQLPTESGFSFSVRTSSPSADGPNAVTKPVPQPSVQFPASPSGRFEFTVNTCHTESIHPSPLNFVEFFDTFIKTHWRGFPGDDF